MGIQIKREGGRAAICRSPEAVVAERSDERTLLFGACVEDIEELKHRQRLKVMFEHSEYRVSLRSNARRGSSRR